MGLWKRKEPSESNISLKEIEERLVDVADNAIILAENKADAQRAVSLRELGGTSPSPYTNDLKAEYNYKLAGERGLMEYDRMRRSDGTEIGRAHV